MSVVLKVKDPINGTSVADWTAYLAAQKAAGTPVQIYTDLPTPITRTLTGKQVEALLGINKLCSNTGVIYVTEHESEILSYVLKDLPIEATVTGDGTATLVVERDGDYKMDRPDESEFDGFSGETIAIKSQNGGTQFSIDNALPDNYDLIGMLDDSASYKLSATLKDAYGQTASAELPFRVDWEHQALLPDPPENLAVVEPDYKYNVVYITPVAPTGTTAGDSVDIYRLSADKPELIYSGAQFGVKYVDPYPTLGEFGGHRVVFKTKNGDYITADNHKAWVDYGIDDGDYLGIWGVLIDFDGNQIHLKYDLKLSFDWKKEFVETKYLGGAVQGDWNSGVSRTGSISTTTIVEEDEDTIELLRRLANYSGHCHLRTPDGSSFACDIQVKEEREERMVNKKAIFSLSITRIDPVGFDMQPYSTWYVPDEDEE